MSNKTSRRKQINLAIAAALTATVVTSLVAPSVSYANSKNIIDRILPVGKDFSSDKMPGVRSYLIIKEDDINFTTGDTFRLSLPSGVNWLTDKYASNTAFNGTNGASLTVVTANKKDIDLKITGDWDNGAEEVEIPLYFEIDGGIGELKVTVVPQGSTISSGSYTFATVPSEKTIVTIPDANNEENDSTSTDVETTPTPEENVTNEKIIFTIGKKLYTQSGIQKKIDVAPFIEANRTYLPLRYVAEAVGIPQNNISWDPTLRKVKVVKGDRTIHLTVGSTMSTINGVNSKMDAAPKIVNGRTMLPVRVVAEALGAEVYWSKAEQTIVIETPNEN